MKENAHPTYQEVLFVDSATNHKFICGTTIQTNNKEMYNGKEYPTIHVPISSTSHPFFVGGKGIVDTEGRVDKFTKRYAAAAQKAQAQEAANSEQKEAEDQKKRKKK
ncbi:MAG: type B 50S ribosomal protein L31 [Chlamydiales bacterium]|nr:type B 50S ribosomal protein L31 [Chlamydiales bacterium]